MYIVNNVPVFAVVIIRYEVNSMTKEARAVLRSRRGDEVSLLSAVAVAVRGVAAGFGRAEGCVSAIPLV